MAAWVDLLDPTEDEVRAHMPKLDHGVVAELLRRADPAQPVRPLIRSYGDYVFGIVLPAVIEPERDRLYYQEVDFVVTHEHVLTVRKTPRGEQPYDPGEVKEICARKEHVPPGMVVYHLLDDVAEQYLDLVDDVDGEIDELEENIDRSASGHTRRRLSELRHDLLRIRRTLAPTRDAVRGIVDGRVDIDRGLLRREVFSEDLERALGTVLDKLLRATESLEFARDLLAAVRDYHATKIANEQNDIIKRLTVTASLLLFPTFIVGVYGQNFEHMPELHWYLGYVFSWGLIVATTVGQLLFFRSRRWI